MYCPMCGCKDVQIVAKKKKSYIVIGMVLVFGGLGLGFLPIPVGFLGGCLSGLVIGLIIRAVSATEYEPVITCQYCGYVGKVKR